MVTSCGAEALPFINGFCVLPASLLFFVYYDKLVRGGVGVGGRCLAIVHVCAARVAPVLCLLRQAGESMRGC